MERELTYATVCSGIECMSVACIGLPLRPVFFSEIEPFPCAVLKAHYPDVPNIGDMSKIQVSDDGKEITNGTTTIRLHERLGILAGGTPCQDVSVAGKRAGMQEGSGTRSSLAFDFVRLARELRPRWVLWENVAGSIDSKNAPDFLRFASALGDCGYSLAWRVLDAQYVRVDGMERVVPQRRRRVWVVGCLGADESVPAQILFEPDCVAGHTAPRRRAGQGFAYSLAGRDRVDAGVVGGARCGSFDPFANGTVPGGGMTESVAQSLVNGDCPGHHNCIALDGDKLKPREDQRKGGNGFGINEEGAGYTQTGVDRHGVAYGIDQQGGKGGANTTEGVAPTVLSDSHGTPHGVAYGMDARNTGLYGAGATGKEVSMTQDANQCKGGKCVVLCADGGEVAATITRQISEQSGQDNRANAVVVSMAQNTRDEVRIVGGDGQIAGALPAEPGMKQQTYVVSTNSNGEDVAPTLNTAMAKLGGDNQTTFGGGYVVSKKEGAESE